MIYVRPAPEPEDFDSQVRRPGLQALRELVGDRRAVPRPGRKRRAVARRIEELASESLPPLWRNCLPRLRTAYRDICSYLGMKIHPATGAATVDHFKPKSVWQILAYEWTNYRLAARQVNASKGEHEDVLDPFEVENGWFELNLGTFEVSASRDLDEALAEKVQATIVRLKLNDPTFCKAREEYHDRYHGLSEAVGNRVREALPLSWLEEECPFVALELERQGRLRPVCEDPGSEPAPDQ